MAGFDDFGDSDLIFVPKATPNKFQMEKEQNMAADLRKKSQNRKSSSKRNESMPRKQE